jgi:hypothetical protein
MKLYLYILFIIFSFIACTSSDDSSYDYNQSEYYDYYEIANNQIVYTSINDGIGNYSGIINGFSNTNDALTINTLQIDNYNLINTALDINETFNASKFIQYNATTNRHLSITYKENFGKYELSTDYCLINYDIDNCKTYIYIRH